MQALTSGGGRGAENKGVLRVMASRLRSLTSSCCATWELRRDAGSWCPPQNPHPGNSGAAQMGEPLARGPRQRLETFHGGWASWSCWFPAAGLCWAEGEAAVQREPSPGESGPGLGPAGAQLGGCVGAEAGVPVRGRRWVRMELKGHGRYRDWRGRSRGGHQTENSLRRVSLQHRPQDSWPQAGT